ncbi:MAG: helix-turn-helix transcriptional regulator [Cutibacterium granulosum]|nr:helix-turn-helix transcriptional regulator [Cutibacterium granulosum]
MDINEAVAAAIRAQRAVSGHTVRELAERSGVPLSTLMRILGAQRDIKVTQVADIAKVLDVAPCEIVEDAERIMGRQNTEQPSNVRRLRGSTPPVPENIAAYRPGHPTERERMEKEWGDDPA